MVETQCIVVYLLVSLHWVITDSIGKVYCISPSWKTTCREIISQLINFTFSKADSKTALTILYTYSHFFSSGKSVAENVANHFFTTLVLHMQTRSNYMMYSWKHTCQPRLPACTKACCRWLGM